MELPISRLLIVGAFTGAMVAGAAFFLVALTTSGGTAEGVSPAPGGQADALADGAVTDAEYAQAVEATVACIQDLGIRTEPPQQQPDGSWVYPYGGAKTLAELNDMEARVKSECTDRLLARIEQTWRASREQETAARLRGKKVLACMERAGYTFSAKVVEFTSQLNEVQRSARATWEGCVAETGGGHAIFAPN